MGKPTYIVLKHPSVFSSVHFSNVISSSFFLYQPSIQSLFKSFWLPNLPSTVKVKVLVTQSCLTLCYPMDCNPPGSSVLGILQTRILEWVSHSIPSSASAPPISLAKRTLPPPQLCQSQPALQLFALTSPAKDHSILSSLPLHWPVPWRSWISF